MNRKTPNSNPAAATIIVPAYNAERYLAATIQSALNQGAAVGQVIVVDDGSSDGTAGIAQGFGGKVAYVRQANGGVSAARNHGLRLATGDWVTFLDADDLLPAGAIEALLRRAAGRARCVVYGDQEVIDAAGAVCGFRRAKPCTGASPAAARASFDEAPFAPGAAIVDRRLANEAGGFDARFQTCADRHFWIRCGALAPFHYEPSIVYSYRRHEQAMSRDRVANAREGALVQIDCLQWARQRGVALFDAAMTAESLLSDRLWRLLLTRRLESFTAIDALTSELAIDGSAISAARKLSAAIAGEGGPAYEQDLVLRARVYQWYLANRQTTNLSPEESAAAQAAFASFAADCQTTASCRGLVPFLKTRKTLRQYGLAPAGASYAAWVRALRRPLARDEG